MSDTYQNRVIETSSNTPTNTGTVTINLSGTSPTMTFIGSGTSAGRLFDDVYASADTIPSVHIYQTNSPSLWCVANITFTAGTPDTLTFVAANVHDGSAGAGALVTFTGTVTCVVEADAEFARRCQQAMLTQVAGTNANTTMEAGSLYVVDMSAWATADRTYTLPATAAVGDRIGIAATVGNASFELIITAGSGDTLNGVAGGTEWSRLFIAGEIVIMRCTVANATWVVESDGRIPQKGLLRLSTSPSENETAATFVYPSAASPTAGVWTADTNIGSCAVIATDKVVARRAGKYNVTLGALSAAVVADQNYFGGLIEKNGSVSLASNATRQSGDVATLRAANIAITSLSLAADDYLRFKYRSQEGSRGLASSATAYETFLSFSEILP